MLLMFQPRSSALRPDDSTMRVGPRLRRILLTSCLILQPTSSLLALPPPDDIPEEVLRAQIILDARSPIDGKPMTASAYAELQATIREAPPTTPEVSPKVKQTLNLLKLRKFLKTFFPFVPIK
jgi:hypothetical protein